MFEKIRKLKNKKGFTLVELIVVLVILAILAALLIPALTGYISRANKQKVEAECRMAVMAIQTQATEIYAKKGKVTSSDLSDADSDIKKLAEVSGTWSATVGADGQVTSVTYINAGWTTTYSKDSGNGAAGYVDTSATSSTMSSNEYK